MSKVFSVFYSGLTRVFNQHRGILLLLLLGAALIFPNLGNDALWNDEGDTAFFALTIKQHGLPLAWDGRNFNYQDLNAMNGNLVMLTLSWFPLYAAAASTVLFGETAWAVRFPFALAGWLTLPALYLLVWRLTRDKRAAISAAVLLLLSVQFLLFIRAARYYSFTMLLVCLALLLFLRLERRRNQLLFSAAVILLFHSLTLPAVCLLAALAFLTTVYRPFFKFRRGFWISILLIIPLTAPWIFCTSWRWTTAQDVATASSFAEWIKRPGQLMIELMMIMPVLGWLALLPFAFRRLKENADLLLLCGTVAIALAFVDILVHNAGNMYVLGVRHYCAMIPLGAALSGVLIASASRGKPGWIALLILIFSATHLGGNFLPWLITRSDRETLEEKVKAEHMHAPRNPLYTVVRAELAGYLFSLWMDNPGPVSETVRILQAQAKPDDLLFTNYEWESVYFYTRIPTTGRIYPEQPVYQAAKKHNLPEYVFDPLAANWIVWRSVAGNRIAPTEFLEKGLKLLREQGKTIRPVAHFKETGWDNRNNLNHHRFPVLGYIYTFTPAFPDVVILRVE